MTSTLLERCIGPQEQEEESTGEKSKAVIWGYRFNDMLKSWSMQTVWIAEGLRDLGYEVLTAKLKCNGLEWCRKYDHTDDNPCDVVVYNHADISHIRGNVVKARRTLFYKPTVPDIRYVTLDPLGYGPFSSIAYDKPDFEDLEGWQVFYDTLIKRWISSKMNKYGVHFYDAGKLPEQYWLILGQCVGDEVVTRHDFGDYRTKLKQVIREVQTYTDIPIVVKLHPYMNGKDAKSGEYSEKFANEVRDHNVHVISGKVDIHSVLPRARAVFTANSGAGIEAMMHHRPVISWGTPEYHWVTYNLRHLADVRRAMEVENWFDPDLQARWILWYYTQYCIYDRESAKRRLVEVL